MKHRIILSLLFFLPFVSFGQNWKKECTLNDGMTLKVGDSIKIIHEATEEVLKVIKPHFHYDDESWFAYRNHIVFMKGGTYEIKRMTRIPKENRKDGYVPLAVIESEYANTNVNIEFTVRIDSAISVGVIQIKKR